MTQSNLVVRRDHRVEQNKDTEHDTQHAQSFTKLTSDTGGARVQPGFTFQLEAMSCATLSAGPPW